MSRISITTRQGVLWVRVDAALGGKLALDLEASVLEAATVGHIPVSVLDLSAVPAMDSAGVGALVRLQTALATKGRKLILANPRPAVADDLRLRDLYAFFHISSEIQPEMDAEDLFLARDA